MTFVSPEYQKDWNFPDHWIQQFGPSGNVYNSHLEGTYSLLYSNHNQYINHVPRDRFKYDIKIEVELGGEVFATYYRTYIWRNDPELMTGEIAEYLIQRVMPDHYEWAAEGVGKLIMDKLTRRFYIGDLV